ncbi:MAG TPA: MCP four helix bundle domain-containing protein [Deltaproteobacteria bacterium]|mgnify:CR=1 FL=1|nr:MCP four helix bundle domain-containing protein [Deltaproteobacteria bacterium]
MGLRIKILLGFLILSFMLVIAGIWSIYELSTVGESVNNLLKDNYQSVQASQQMIDALEREDSGVLLLLSGQWTQGREILDSADEAFQKAFTIARNNLTLPHEDEYIAEIDKNYLAYKALWERPIVDTSRQGDISWYFSEMHKAFQTTKDSVKLLMVKNEDNMYSTAIELKNRAHRAVMPGIVAIISALVVTLIFIYFVNYYFVTPIIRITRGVKDFQEKEIPFKEKFETRDEISDLAESIRTLLAQLRSYETKK